MAYTTCPSDRPANVTAFRSGTSTSWPCRRRCAHRTLPTNPEPPRTVNFTRRARGTRSSDGSWKTTHRVVERGIAVAEQLGTHACVDHKTLAGYSVGILGRQHVEAMGRARQVCGIRRHQL